MPTMRTEDFYVCWYDPISGAHGLQVGMNDVKENCAEWLEANEVAAAFRSERNGMYYYIGNFLAEPVTCPVEEIQDALKDTGYPDRDVRRAMYLNFLATAKELNRE